ncbi:MAG TPA: hypothetical protein VD978_13425 [Azospirillum sp.]|nr:hypothetical protein [Azospirillum sp.]
MPEKVTATIRAEELPSEIRAQLRERAVPGARFRVTAEPADESDDEKLEALRADLRKGRDELRDGRGIDGDEAFARLEAKYPPPTP